MNCQLSRERGVTLIELLVIVGIFGILAIVAAPAMSLFERESDLLNTAEEIRSVLRLAQNKTTASQDQTTYGVYFDNTATTQQYILFQGADYASRVATADDVYKLPDSVEFDSINFDGGKEVVFDRISGATSQPGDASIRLAAATSTMETIYVESSGKITPVSSSAASDTSRATDSRHVHINYTNRTIEPTAEKLVLTFSSVTQDIIMQDNMQGGQIFWEGDVVDAGETQHLKIHTHALNDPTLWTQFCVHRDRRLNTKPLTITIDAVSGPDPDPGSIISYEAAGQTATGTSIYVSSPSWQ